MSLSPSSALLCMILRRTFFCLLLWKDTRVVSCLKRNFDSPSEMSFFFLEGFWQEVLVPLDHPHHFKFVFCEGFGQFQICEIIVTGDIATTSIEILCKCHYVCRYPNVSFSGFCTCRFSQVGSASKCVVC